MDLVNSFLKQGKILVIENVKVNKNSWKILKFWSLALRAGTQVTAKKMLIASSELS